MEEERSYLLPTPTMRLAFSEGGTRSSQSDLVYLRVGFMPPLSDYGSCRAGGAPLLPLLSDCGLPKAGTTLTTSYGGSPRTGDHTPPTPKTCQWGPSTNWGPDLFLPDYPLLPTPGFTDTFNMDTRKPRIIAGSRAAFFGYTVQQHDISGNKW